MLDSKKAMVNLFLTLSILIIVQITLQSDCEGSFHSDVFDFPFGLANLQDHTFIVGGSTLGSLFSDNKGLEDIWIARLTSNGESTVWSYQHGTGYTDSLRDLAITDDEDTVCFTG